MKFSFFLEKIQNFLNTGYLDIPGKECQVSGMVPRLVLACSLFERESYKNIENVSAEQYRSFCKMFTSALVSVSLSEFNSSISSLDFKSRDLLLRGIEYSSKEFSSLDLSNYSRLL